ncbi:MAG: tetratricopeptide repeat protein [Desulfovibrionaceae bacterium]|nr:tetratricopeptide repeat protein [Desulfovibrionaceae bacterium]
MEATGKSIKEHIARAKASIQRKDYLKALKSLCTALELLVQSNVFGREKFEIGILLSEVLRDLMGVPAISRLFSKPLAYEKGKEKALYRTLRRLHDKMKQAIEDALLQRKRNEYGQLDEMIIAGQEYLAKKEPLEARKLFRKAAEQFPDVPGLLSDLGGRLTRAGLFQEALEYLKRALEADVLDSRAYSYMVMCYEGLGDMPKAEEVIRSVLKRFGANEVLSLRLAKIALDRRNWSEAYEQAEAVLASSPMNTEARRILRAAKAKVFRPPSRPASAPAPAPAPAAPAAPASGEEGGEAPKTASGKPIKLDF